MRQQQSLLSITLFVLLGAAAAVCARAQEPPAQEPPAQAPPAQAPPAQAPPAEEPPAEEPPAQSRPAQPNTQESSAAPEGSASRVSDWAVAGVVWSDASLARKIASELAAAEGISAAEKDRLKSVQRKLEIMIEELENFGWRQVRRSPRQTAAKMPAGEQSLEAGLINRLDTENPAGASDPSMDDELQPRDTNIDVDQYRVDDYVDETEREKNNLADAVEDEVEGAIAAGAGRIGMAQGTAGRISRREAQTRSATMPLASDTIYDRDDYDPDVDYEYQNPYAEEPPAPTEMAREDADDDVEATPAEVVQGEDELAAALLRNDGNATPRSAAIGKLDAYTDKRSEHADEADLIQYRLKANQALWNQLAQDGLAESDLKYALTMLRSNAVVGRSATSTSRLQDVLQRLASVNVSGDDETANSGANRQDDSGTSRRNDSSAESSNNGQGRKNES